MLHTRRILRVIVCALCLAFPTAPAFSEELTLRNTPVEVYFSPNGGAQEAIVEAIDHAKSTILAQAYSFTSKPIAQALSKALKRGVKVEVILDSSQRDEKYSGATFLRNAGIAVTIDDEHAIAHNKVMVIDTSLVITGSFNFTKAAEFKNAENVLVIHDQKMAKLYAGNWQAHREHSTPYDGPVHAAAKGKKASPGVFRTFWRNILGQE